ncbi:hypothetical protein BX600DRAFT_193600 [Xylariales sp. PMI_506]|nr:hypothetical protein BX600DRAFT_193600 [Xylariales sp. PMI_506]
MLSSSHAKNSTSYSHASKNEATLQSIWGHAFVCIEILMFMYVQHPATDNHGSVSRIPSHTDPTYQAKGAFFLVLFPILGGMGNHSSLYYSRSVRFFEVYPDSSTTRIHAVFGDRTIA